MKAEGTQRTRWALALMACALGAGAPAALTLASPAGASASGSSPSPATASAATISITAPASVARNTTLSLRVSGVAPPDSPDRHAASASVTGWVQPASDGACPAQEPVEAPSGAWGFVPEASQAVTNGAPFSVSWTADTDEALGHYDVCAWTEDDAFTTAAAAQAALTLRPAHLRLTVTVPRHARVGRRGTFAVSANLEGAAYLGVILLAPRVYVCPDSGANCQPRHFAECPARFQTAANLANHVEADITPFARAVFDPDATAHAYRGRVTLRTRLRAQSAGEFRLCAYAQEEGGDAPPPFAEGHAFAAFHVTG